MQHPLDHNVTFAQVKTASDGRDLVLGPSRGQCPDGVRLELLSDLLVKLGQKDVNVGRVQHGGAPFP